MDHIFHNETAKKAFKYLKKFKTLEDSDGTVLDIIRPDVAITTTVEILKGNVNEGDQVCTKQSAFVGSDSFIGASNAVGSMEILQGHQPNTATGRDLYWKGGRIPTDICRLYKRSFPLTCRQFLRNV